jgi:hypothetical protein
MIVRFHSTISDDESCETHCSHGFDRFNQSGMHAGLAHHV